jgi:membrane protein
VLLTRLAASNITRLARPEQIVVFADLYSRKIKWGSEAMRDSLKPSTESIQAFVASITDMAASAFMARGKNQRKQKSIAEMRRSVAQERAELARSRPVLATSAAAGADVATQAANRAASAPSKKLPYWRDLLQVALSAAKAWSAHRAASKGAALALYTLFSLAPMLVLIVAVAGFVFGADTVREAIVGQMSGLMGSQGGEAIKTIIGGGHKSSDGFWAGLVSAGLVLVSATSAFAELKDSLDELWEVPASTKSGLWSVIRERFLSFGLILVLTLMLLASLGVSAGLAAMGNLLGGDTSSPFRIVSLVISNLVSLAVLTALFSVIFKYLPAVKIAWRDVIVGGVLTALLFIVGKSLIGLYVAHADISSSYGAAGSIVILITWIYYSAQIFFYGSLFTHEYAQKLGSRVKPRKPEDSRATGAANKTS